VVFYDQAGVEICRLLEAYLAVAPAVAHVPEVLSDWLGGKLDCERRSTPNCRTPGDCGILSPGIIIARGQRVLSIAV